MPLLPDMVDDKPAHTIALANGRRLAITEWGDAQGFPVFYCHGTPSSRLEGAFADQAAKRAGFRLIAIDRPGFGLSDFQPGRRFMDWPGDIAALANALDITRFGMAGHSGAGPHLFACGVALPPERLAFIGALGPWAPVATPDIIASLSPLDRFFAAIARKLPWIMHLAFAPLGWSAKHWPSLFFRIMKGSVGPADRQMLDDDRLLDIFRVMEREAFRQGSRGGAHEAFIAYRDWGFDIADIKVPTHIWLGTEDIFVPRTMGDYMARRIPGVDFNWVEGAGHFCIDKWDAIFTACQGDLHRADREHA